MIRGAVALLGAALLVPVTAVDAGPAPARAALPATASGRTPAGADWNAEVPPNWNGTLLLWGRGYSPRKGAPDVAPPAWKQALLDQGYALAGSNYGAEG